MTGGPFPTGDPVAARIAATSATAGQPAAFRAEIMSLPPELLARLGRSVAINGSVAGTTADGTLRIRTQFGEIALRTTATSPAGRPATIQIPPAPAGSAPLQTPVQAILLLPQSAAAGLALPPHPAPGTPPGPTAPAPAGGVAPQPPSTAAPPASASQLIGLAVTGIRTASPGPLSGMPTAGNGPEPAPVPPAPTRPAVPSSPLPVASGTAQSPLARLAESIATTVGSLPPSRVMAVHRPPAVLAPEPSRSGASFPALRDALSALAKLDPAIARQVVHTILPQPNGQLPGTLLLFVAMMRKGDVRGWLGERATRALEAAGRADLIARLAGELASGSGTGGSAQPQGAEWRPQPIPLLHGGEIVPVHLWLQRPGSPTEEDGTSGSGRCGTRFLIDLDLSRLGPLQLDGHVEGRRLDLILRSSIRFPGPLRDGLVTRFAAACAASNLAGRLRFQPGGDGWVRPAAGGQDFHTVA